MLALSTPATFAIIGLIIGIGLSVYVGHADWTRVRTGVQSRPQYRGSLVVTPLLLAGIGALFGLLLTAIF